MAARRQRVRDHGDEGLALVQRAERGDVLPLQQVPHGLGLDGIHCATCRIGTDAFLSRVARPGAADYTTTIPCG
ncbi:hypothetical protein GCM10028813_47950 [Ramlibacter alkalitolerans]